MKILFKFIFCCCFFSFFYASNKIVAIVGDEVVLQSDLDEMFFLQKNQGLDISKEAVLNGMIEQKVLVYFARKDSSLVVDDSQLNQMVKQQLDTYKDQFGGSVEALEKYFDKSFSQVFDFLYKQGEDLFLANQLKQKLFYQVSVSSSEVRDFYSEKKDFLEPTPPLFSYSYFNKKIEPSEKRVLKTKELADSVLFEINSGKDFSSFYSTFSGGDVEFKRGDFGLPEFEWAAFSLKTSGEVVGPVLTSLGFHLIELTERLGEKVRVNHLLFPVSLEKEDEDFVFNLTKEVLELSSKDLKKLDAACKQKGVEDGGLSGVFTGAPKEFIPKDVFDVLNTLSPGEFSSTLRSGDSFFFVYLSKKTPSAAPTLAENWEQIEWAALQNKFSVFFNNWYSKNKSQVYIKKNTLR